MGCGASTAAPYLKKYFASVEKFAKDELDQAMKMMGGDPMAMMFDPQGRAKMQKMQEESIARAKKFKDDAISLLEQSFAHHDKNNSDVLEVEESKLFFSNLVDLQTGSIEALARMSIKIAVDGGVKAMAALMDKAQANEVKKEMKAQATEGLKDLEDKIKKAVEAYKADKENKDKAAFAMLDVNKDGKLQKKEFLAAFDVVDGSKSGELLKALGLDVGEQISLEMQAPDCSIM